jgi:hypothetical protein
MGRVSAALDCWFHENVTRDVAAPAAANSSRPPKANARPELLRSSGAAVSLIEMRTAISKAAVSTVAAEPRRPADSRRLPDDFCLV